MEKTKTFDTEMLTSDIEYDLNITLYGQSKLFNIILKRARKALAKQKGIEFDSEQMRDIKEVDIPEDYHGFIKTTLSKKVKREGSIITIESNRMLRYGKVMLSHKVVSAKLEKEGDLWKIKVVVNGLYSNRN